MSASVSSDVKHGRKNNSFLIGTAIKDMFGLYIIYAAARGFAV
nr:MAG TPA: hypothetical protein [Caudoviricetes sp.]